jgi:RHS repeat-associated protein
VDSATTQYALDLAATLPVVISDTEAVYLYGLDIIAQQQSERLYHAHDGLGSVRQLLDTTGQIETNYAYDRFGVPLVGGEVYNPYQYTGEAWDGEVELLYLRARYYQPEVGRFVTKDPWIGNPRAPATLNRYVYAVNNPANYTDPTGMQGPDPHGTIDIDSPKEPSRTPAGQVGPPRMPGDIQTPPLVTKLARIYGLRVLSTYAYYQDWELHHLELLEEAAGDFAGLMQGGEAGFRDRLAPVLMYRAAEGTMPLGWAGGFTYLTHITLSGVRAHWLDEGHMKWIIVHELAHWWDQNGFYRLAREMLAEGMWGSDQALCQVPREERGSATPRPRHWLRARRKEPANLREDWADSVAAYVYWRFAERVSPRLDGPWLISPSRWEYVARQMNPQDPQDYPWSGRESEFTR